MKIHCFVNLKANFILQQIFEYWRLLYRSRLLDTSKQCYWNRMAGRANLSSQTQLGYSRGGRRFQASVWTTELRKIRRIFLLSKPLLWKFARICIEFFRNYVVFRNIRVFLNFRVLRNFCVFPLFLQFLTFRVFRNIRVFQNCGKISVFRSIHVFLSFRVLRNFCISVVLIFSAVSKLLLWKFARMHLVFCAISVIP